MSPRANNSKGEAVVNDSPADCQSRRADRSIFSAEKMQDRAVQVQPPQPKKHSARGAFLYIAHPTEELTY